MLGLTRLRCLNSWPSAPRLTNTCPGPCELGLCHVGALLRTSGPCSVDRGLRNDGLLYLVALLRAAGPGGAGRGFCTLWLIDAGALAKGGRHGEKAEGREGCSSHGFFDRAGPGHGLEKDGTYC